MDLVLALVGVEAAQLVAAASMLRPAVVGCSRGRGQPGAEGEGVWGSELVFTDYVRATPPRTSAER